MKDAHTLSVSILLIALVSTAHAAIEVTFVEDAPKDRFVIANAGDCTVEHLTVVIDLAPSAGGLYFDTTDSGAGVQVFQPFEVADGALRLLSGDVAGGSVQDGQKSLTVQIAHLAAGARAGFTIDVDDTVVGGALGQSRVTTAEISGSRVRLERDAHAPLEARFDAAGKAVTPPLPCPARGS